MMSEEDSAKLRKQIEILEADEVEQEQAEQAEWEERQDTLDAVQDILCEMDAKTFRRFIRSVQYLRKARNWRVGVE